MSQDHPYSTNNSILTSFTEIDDSKAGSNTISDDPLLLIKKYPCRWINTTDTYNDNSLFLPSYLDINARSHSLKTVHNNIIGK